MIDEELSIEIKRVQMTAMMLRTKLLLGQPFYGFALTKLCDIQPDMSISSFATDGKTIYFNPNFSINYKVAELNFILMHELYHVILQHRLRSSKLGSFNRKFWNIACDDVVNYELSQVIQSLHDEAGVDMEIPADACIIRDESGEIKDISDCNAESIYRELIEAYDQKQSNSSGDDESEDDESGDDEEDIDNSLEEISSFSDTDSDNSDDDDDQSDSNDNGISVENEESDDSESADGDNEGDSEESDDSESGDSAGSASGGNEGENEESDSSEGEGNTEQGDEQESGAGASGNGEGQSEDSFFSNDQQLSDGSVQCMGGPDDLTEGPEAESVDDIKREIEQSLREFKSKGWDKNSALVATEIERVFTKSKIRWDKYLRKFLTSRITDENSYDSPNKKYLPYDLIMPGPGGSDQVLGDIAVFIDTSGSMNEEEIKDILNNAYTIATEYNASMSIGLWSTKMYYVVQDIEPDDIEKTLRELEIKSGGTDYDCVVETMLQKDFIHSTCYVVFTDGYFDIPSGLKKRMTAKTILALDDTKHYDKALDSLGKVVSYKDEDTPDF